MTQYADEAAPREGLQHGELHPFRAAALREVVVHEHHPRLCAIGSRGDESARSLDALHCRSRDLSSRQSVPTCSTSTVP